jgi:hypothetical protein
VDAHQLGDRVSAEIDDVLSTLQLVHSNQALQDRLFDQLVDLLVERLFVSCQQRYLAGELDRAAYVGELGELAGQCHRAGLLPLPGAAS